jgi:hypothetical protein
MSVLEKAVVFVNLIAGDGAATFNFSVGVLADE